MIKLKKIKRYTFLVLMGLSMGFVSSCSNDDPSPSPYVDRPQTTVLVYAVATNNLSSNLVSDKNEMLQAGHEIDLTKNNVLVFENTYSAGQRLLKMNKIGEEYDFEVVEEFSSSISSLDPERMQEVFNYVANNYESDNYGLILWSHSTASQPFLVTKSTSTQSGSEAGEAVQLPSQYSFGYDNESTVSDFVQINIDTLAEAIPYDFFDFIWFDSCYMSNIETIYQIRNKANYFVGYATEVWEWGLPYNLVLPHLLGANPDLVAGAQKFFDYYDELSYENRNATIAVVDLSKINSLAEICASVYEQNLQPPTSDFIKYTRGSTGPFYDLGDYTKAMAELQGISLSDEEWNAALDNCVIYKAATPNDFNYHPIDPERFSGISTHVYDFETNSAAENYYQSYDWFKSVF